MHEFRPCFPVTKECALLPAGDRDPERCPGMTESDLLQDSSWRQLGKWLPEGELGSGEADAQVPGEQRSPEQTVV